MLYKEQIAKLKLLTSLVSTYYDIDIHMDNKSAVKLKLYNQRMHDLRPDNISNHVKSRSSFYGLYMLTNKNEKTKYLLRHLQKKFRSETASSTALQENVDNIFAINKQKDNLILEMQREIDNQLVLKDEIRF